MSIFPSRGKWVCRTLDPSPHLPQKDRCHPVNSINLLRELKGRLIKLFKNLYLLSSLIVKSWDALICQIMHIICSQSHTISLVVLKSPTFTSTLSRNPGFNKGSYGSGTGRRFRRNIKTQLPRDKRHTANYAVVGS